MAKSLNALAALLVLVGCQDQEAPAAARTAAADGSPAAAELPSEPAVPDATDPDAKARNEKIDNGVYEFAYSYPAKAARYSNLREWLDGRLEKQRGEVEKSAREDKANAEKDGYPYRPHSSETEWKVVTDLPGWLSLSAESYEYTGGAHGMSYFDTLLWDKAARKVREPTELFASSAALRDAIQKPFCDALDRERAKRRGEPVQRDNGDTFNECINPLESVVILGSKSGKGFDRLGVLVAPYAAGAYAEGSYEVTLPITPAVVRAAKPEYRGAFATGG
ncbi:DUF4163 domain-containing protein [Novosphingobium aquimarinum]|uniref:DUF4163 domain-containing protein n=1 Tax=Novosphingobium aquimarinum TaxID=2682494 RepID=UPI0012EB641C|nr:DUF4163 domain-containing protein [Novosphingobium aquimarinum]